MNLWIKNGHVLDPANHLDEVCDVYVKEGKVACVGSLSSDKIPDECTVIDAEGKYVMPGLVDLHVHLREPGLSTRKQFIPVRTRWQRAVLQRFARCQIQSL